MHLNWELFTLLAALSSSAGALTTVNTSQSLSTSRGTSTTVQSHSSVAVSTSTTTHAPSQTSHLSPCAQVSQRLASPASTGIVRFNPILAMSCLESVPLSVQKSLEFIEYISPFIEFQSTLGYLKDPPLGYPMPGVDVFDGLAVITEKVTRLQYANQYAFEKELHVLINVRPRDFHFNLPLPLIDLFSFTTGTDATLVSISADGKSLPDVYFQADLLMAYQSNVILRWKPSPIVSINDQRAADYLLRAGLETLAWADPDTIYNLMFNTPALLLSTNGDSWVGGGHTYGFPTENTTYVFANQSKLVLPNHAATRQNFSGIDSGAALFEKFEVPKSAGSRTKRSDGGKSKRVTTATATVTRVPGYPTPVIIDPASGYTGGYFLPNSTVAVLVMAAFEAPASESSNELIQQSIIQSFLQKCKAAGKTKLIVDVQGNGGGLVFNGEFTFLQLFPPATVLGATRTRWTPMVEVLAQSYSEAVDHNLTLTSQFDIHNVLNVNLKNFTSYKEFVGPVTIHDDKFTAIARPNVQKIEVELGVSTATTPPALFSPENVVIVSDGLCGSTCAIFAELMRTQGGVRSVSVGGRPMAGPMQLVTGSKGAQVLSYGEVQSEWITINEVYKEKKWKLPILENPDKYNLSFGQPPLGGDISQRARFNLRNNYNSTSISDLPLQFIYEAANCRLYMKAEDLFDISNLWKRVADVTWGTGKCVSGSTVNSDDTMPKHGYQARSYDPRSFANFTVNSALPGTVYFNEPGSSSQLTLGAAIAALWAW